MWRKKSPGFAKVSPPTHYAIGISDPPVLARSPEGSKEAATKREAKKPRQKSFALIFCLSGVLSGWRERRRISYLCRAASKNCFPEGWLELKSFPLPPFLPTDRREEKNCLVSPSPGRMGEMGEKRARGRKLRAKISKRAEQRVAVVAKSNKMRLVRIQSI